MQLGSLEEYPKNNIQKTPTATQLSLKKIARPKSCEDTKTTKATK
jgi:hypothetical protein